MRKISLFLAILLLASSCFAGLMGCEKEAASEDKTKVAGDLSEIVAAVNDKISFEDKVSEVIYKAEDESEMMMLLYGIVDINAADHLIDYVITTPGNSHTTFAVFVFDDEMTQDDYEEVRETVANEYMRTQASSLQMYMPEEYAIMSWAVEHQDLVWRQYDNALALIIDGDKEATTAWEAFESVALK